MASRGVGTGDGDGVAEVIRASVGPLGEEAVVGGCLSPETRAGAAD